jgi:hypothetical protein
VCPQRCIGLRSAADAMLTARDSQLWPPQTSRLHSFARTPDTWPLEHSTICKNNLTHTKQRELEAPAGRGHLRCPSHLDEGSPPNNSSLKARLNPDELNLPLSASSVPKASPCELGLRRSFWPLFPRFKKDTRNTSPRRVVFEAKLPSVLLLLLQKGLAYDIASQLVIVIPLAALARSITTPDC